MTELSVRRRRRGYLRHHGGRVPEPVRGLTHMAGPFVLSIIIPTRNEADNVDALIELLDDALGGVSAQAIFVDDSNDATPEVIESAIERRSAADTLQISMVHRAAGDRDGGLSGAVVAGLAVATGDWVCVMDGDLQHPPEVIPSMLAAAEAQDATFVVASRYRDGGDAAGLAGLPRVVVSRGASVVAKALFRTALRHVSDPMSGFFLFRRDVVDPRVLRPHGFKVLVEIAVRTPGLRIVEVPYTFGERHAGESKANYSVGVAYARHLARLRIDVTRQRISGVRRALRAQQLPRPEIVAPPPTVDSPAPLTPTTHTSLQCSVGIMAYNEEANIANSIRAVLAQDVVLGDLAEVIVVASGCTDRTAEIVDSIARRDPRVRLIVEEQRAGKASAINEFIAGARTPVLLMVNADTMVAPGTIDALVQHFDDPTVGMVGGHPIPVNDESSFLGFAVHLQWRLHDEISRETPKLGEIVAFRNTLAAIPTETAVDELSIEAYFSEAGYRLVYEPRAIVYNRGPTTVRDFVRQRRRIAAGHVTIAKREGYSASTMSVTRVARALLDSESFRDPRATVWMAGAVALEGAARLLGHYDVLRRRSHNIWTMISTTKDDIGDAGNAAERSVLVFQLVDFSRDRLELGAHAARSLLHRAQRQIVTCLGPTAAVSALDDGTLIVSIPCSRREAEDAAVALAQELEVVPFLATHREERQVHVACRIVTFAESARAHGTAISAAVG